MDCARFVEENGTLENQMSALSKDGRKRDETIVYPTVLSAEPSPDRYIPVKKVWIPACLRFVEDRVRFEIRRSYDRALR